jgi:peptide/nickel transport system permease protein
MGSSPTSDPVVAESTALEFHPEVAPRARARRHHLWIVRRLALAVVTLFAVSIIVFAATVALPGDAAKAILGQGATPERVEALREQLDLDKPAVRQYLGWVGGVLRGDLGTSIAAEYAFVEDTSVTTVLGPKITNTAVLVLFTAVITFPLSVLLGVYTAVRRDRAVDHAFTVISLVLNAVPGFVVAMALVVLLATTVWKWLPAVSLIPQGESPFDHLRSFILPVTPLVLLNVPYLARLIRGSMIDVLESEYVQLARLKGLRERTILWRHALPNALVPTIQGSALVLAWVAGEIVLIEYVFSFPGIGSALVTAVQQRDVPVIQAATLILAGFYVVVNLFADMLTVVVTPRLRTGGR